MHAGRCGATHSPAANDAPPRPVDLLHIAADTTGAAVCFCVLQAQKVQDYWEQQNKKASAPGAPNKCVVQCVWGAALLRALLGHTQGQGQVPGLHGATAQGAAHLAAAAAIVPPACALPVNATIPHTPLSSLLSLHLAPPLSLWRLPLTPLPLLSPCSPPLPPPGLCG